MTDKLIKIIAGSLIIGALACSSGCIVPYNFRPRGYDRNMPYNDGHEYIGIMILGFPGHYESSQREPVQKEPARVIKNQRSK